MSCEFLLIEPGSAWHAAERRLRHAILRAPLGLPPGSERFAFEDDCLHLVAAWGEELVGCVLFHPEDAARGRLLQMAVAPGHRGTGLGRALVQRLEEEVSTRGFTEIHLHARADAVGFYVRLGYVPQGEPYVELGIPHRNMDRRLGEDASSAPYAPKLG